VLILYSKFVVINNIEIAPILTDYSISYKYKIKYNYNYNI